MFLRNPKVSFKIDFAETWQHTELIALYILDLRNLIITREKDKSKRDTITLLCPINKYLKRGLGALPGKMLDFENKFWGCFFPITNPCVRSYPYPFSKPVGAKLTFN